MPKVEQTNAGPHELSIVILVHLHIDASPTRLPLLKRRSDNPAKMLTVQQGIDMMTGSDREEAHVRRKCTNPITQDPCLMDPGRV